MFFRRLSNSQSAACWVLCGVLMYIYGCLEEKELGTYEESSAEINPRIGPKQKN